MLFARFVCFELFNILDMSISAVSIEGFKFPNHFFDQTRDKQTKTYREREREREREGEREGERERERGREKKML